MKPDANDQDDAAAPPPERPGATEQVRPPRPAEAVLPRDVQEHLGQQLRTEYDVVAEKPAFLGDPAIPEQFDWHIMRLETRERAHNQAVEAVERALEDIVSERVEPEAGPPEDADGR